MALIDEFRGESYTEQEFFDIVEVDIAQSRRSGIFATGFLSSSRIQRLEAVLSKRVQSGVHMSVFVKPPDNWGRSLDLQTSSERHNLRQFDANVQHLQEIGVHVNLRSGSHYKMVIIDGSIFWDGSLNVLSCGNRTKERMTRWVDPIRCANAIKLHGLDNCEPCGTKLSSVNPEELMLRPDTVGGVIRARRKVLKISQAQLARLIGVDRRTLSRIESGERSPDAECLIKIAAVLGREVCFLPTAIVPNVGRLIELEHG
jgi:DNA-binding XRE family transcriptional regulator